MTTNKERAGAILAEWADSEGGLTAIDNDYGGDMTGAVEALVDAGLLMPDLPAPDAGEISGIADWHVNSWGVSVHPDNNGHPAMIYVENRTRMTKPYVFNPQKGREFGEVMIAAANRAEQEQSNE